MAENPEAPGPHHGAESGANAGADAGHGGASRTHCFADTVSAPRGGADFAQRGVPRSSCMPNTFRHSLLAPRKNDLRRSDQNSVNRP